MLNGIGGRFCGGYCMWGCGRFGDGLTDLLFKADNRVNNMFGCWLGDRIQGIPDGLAYWVEGGLYRIRHGLQSRFYRRNRGVDHRADDFLDDGDDRFGDVFDNRFCNRRDDLTDDWCGNVFDDGFYYRGSDLIDDRLGYLLNDGLSDVADDWRSDLVDDGFGNVLNGLSNLAGDGFYNRSSDLVYRIDNCFGGLFDEGLGYPLNDRLDDSLSDRNSGFFEYGFDNRRRTFRNHGRCHLFAKWFGNLLREGTKEIAVVGIRAGCTDDHDAECCKKTQDQSAQGNGDVVRSITVHVFTSPRVTSVT
ncbi:hypothetical protein GCM10027402_04090 [Arthrobacter monumenti]